MVCSGHAGGNGLLHKPSWFHSDEGGQVPERGWKWKEEEGRGRDEKTKKHAKMRMRTIIKFFYCKHLSGVLFTTT